MPDLVYGSAAIEQARVAAAAQSRRIPALADLLGAGTADLGVDGLDSGGALMGALADLRAALEGELTAGGGAGGRGRPRSRRHAALDAGRGRGRRERGCGG